MSAGISQEVYRISNRRKGKVIDFMDRPDFQRGTVLIATAEYPAVRFKSGIVHVMKTRRGVRVSKAIANTFIPNMTKDSDFNDDNA